MMMMMKKEKPSIIDFNNIENCYKSAIHKMNSKI